jgi:hypothetical protein
MPDLTTVSSGIAAGPDGIPGLKAVVKQGKKKKIENQYNRYYIVA